MIVIKDGQHSPLVVLKRFLYPDLTSGRKPKSIRLQTAAVSPHKQPGPNRCQERFLF